MATYEEHCRNLGEITSVLVDIVQEALPLQTFKPSIDAKNSRILNNVYDDLTTIGNDGLSLKERSKRPPCAILLGTSSAGKTEILGSFLPKLREFAGSNASDTTPMLVRMRYPKEFNPADHGRVTYLMPRDLVKLMTNLSRVREAIRADNQLADSWDVIARIERDQNIKRDESYDRKLYKATKSWVREAYQWARVGGDEAVIEYFETLMEITDHFDPDSEVFNPYNPVSRGALIAFLDKGKDVGKLSQLLRDRERMNNDDANRVGKIYYLMRTIGAITQLFIEEDILKEIDIYDTAGVRVGGKESKDISAKEQVHSQIQAFKNRWGFERLIPSVDIVIFILVLEEQQVDTEFQQLFEECGRYGNLENRLFIFLNKLDKAVSQAINKDDIIKKDGEIIPDEDMTWKLWVKTNVMDKIKGLGDNFKNVFLCRAPKFKIEGDDKKSFIENSKNSATLGRYLYDVKNNLDSCMDDNDGGIRFAWKTVEKIMRTQGAEIRYKRLGQQILPLAKDVLNVLGAKRVAEAQPTDKEIDEYLEKLLRDLNDLRWRNEEFRLPQRFGEFCLQKKYCTSKQLEEALEEQKKGEEDTGRRIRIGQIMVDRNYMTLDQVRDVVQAAETEEEDWEIYQKSTFDHVRERVKEQIISFMEEKGRPIIIGNIPVEAVISYLTEPISELQSELKGIYTNKERKEFQEAVQNVMECQLLASLWNQKRLRKHLWDQKPRITSSFHIRDDISKEEAIKVTECYDQVKDVYDRLPAIDSKN